MLTDLWHYITSHSASELGRDALDIFLTYYLFYRALLVVRGTRAIQVGLGLAAVFALYLLALVFQLATVLSILSTLLSSALLIAVVVFQNDIRRGLMRVGSGAWFGAARSQESRVIDEVVDAATYLARHRVGAIITFEQDANLDEFVGVNKGRLIDAAVSHELLVSLFIPEAMNELHDGAVIIRNLRIAKAGVFFPMPETRVADESFGSRHRAALGITEETDAVVVVVSEERGSISFCFNGNIVSNLDGPGLRAALEGIFVPKKPAKKRGRQTIKKSAVVEVPAPPPKTISDSEEPPSVKETPLPEVAAEASVTDHGLDSAEETPPPLRKSKTAVESEPRKEAVAPLRKADIATRSSGGATPAPTTELVRPMPRASQPDPLRRSRVPDEEGNDSEPNRNDQS